MPLNIFKIGCVINPSAIPVAILEVSGIVKIIKKAGKASSNSPHLTLTKLPIIKLPTIMSAGEVMAAMPETALTSGLKNAATIKRIPTVKEVSPVRPPAATPLEDSMKAVVGLVPNIEPTDVANESDNKACLARGNLFPFIKPACWATPIIVPVVSNIVTNKNEKTTA